MNFKAPTSLHTNLLIVTLAECVIFTTLWLWNEYVATYVTLILPGMMFVILLISLISDWIEPSRIPKWYYYSIVITLVVPLVIGGFFIYIYGGNMSWMK